jgi:hypothetical protein
MISTNSGAYFKHKSNHLPVRIFSFNDLCVTYVRLIAFVGSLSFIEIDQFSFSPGPHTLTIAFSVSTGEQGEFVYEFTGLVRERMSLYW